MPIRQTRRDFLLSSSLAAVSGAAGVLGARGSLAQDGPPETTTVRIGTSTSVCLAPQLIAEELLRAEGFTDIRYPQSPGGLASAVEEEDDFWLTPAPVIVFHLDAGEPITTLAGVHSGCYELFAHGSVKTISDLKGKRIGIRNLSSSGHLYVAMMAAHVGLDPQNDLEWVTSPTGEAMELFAQRQVDAFIGFPPEPQELRARDVGHVILDTTTDRPWSQYFCCMLCGRPEFVDDYPVATKRVVRAILKATDICATEPRWAAKRLVDAGFTGRYDYALQTLTELPYDRWREFDPEDSMRFYALRLHEAGMITSSPNKLIAAGTDWRFLNELKRELKA
jgi:NitT/TauT family transport system substrate-binding protein